MPNFKRGAAAIEKATEQRGGGEYKTFAPKIFWSKSGDSRVILFLNRVEDIPTAGAITFVPRKGKKKDGSTYTIREEVIARTDPAIGESSDPMVDNWDGKVRATSFAVAVELEVQTEEDARGRQRPVGFTVKTNEFERRVRDANGELTDDRETVEAPAIGFITQSPNNFFNVIAAYDAEESPVHETPLKITRVGADKNTSYTPIGYPDQPVDLSGLLDNIDVISYLGKDAEAVVETISTIEDDFDAALAVGEALLDKRLDEISDRAYYDELYDGIDETLDPWSKNKGGGNSNKRAAAPRAARASRPSQRKVEKSEAPVEDEPNEPDPVDEAPEAPAEEAPVAAPEDTEDKPKVRRGRAAAGGESDAKAQMERLKARAKSAGKATSAA